MTMLPSDAIMRTMSKIAIEKATASFAEVAETMAREMRDGLIDEVSGPDALDAFARAIREVNAELYPKEARKQN